MFTDPLNLMEWLNVMFRTAVAAVIAFKLYRFYDFYERDERFGLGVAGGCSLLTVPVVTQGPASPFAGWSGMLFAFGVLIYVGGRLRRQFRHERANREQLRIAREYKETRGK